MFPVRGAPLVVNQPTRDQLKASFSTRSCAAALACVAFLATLGSASAQDVTLGGDVWGVFRSRDIFSDVLSTHTTLDFSGLATPGNWLTIPTPWYYGGATFESGGVYIPYVTAPYVYPFNAVWGQPGELLGADGSMDLIVTPPEGTTAIGFDAFPADGAPPSEPITVTLSDGRTLDFNLDFTGMHQPQSTFYGLAVAEPGVTIRSLTLAKNTQTSTLPPIDNLTFGTPTSATDPLTVTSDWTTGRLVVGDTTPMSLVIAGGATVTGSSGVIGQSPGAAGSSVTVTGSGSQWLLSDKLVTGAAADNALLRIEAGGKVTAPVLNIGEDSSFAKAIVTGAGSTLTVDTLNLGTDGATPGGYFPRLVVADGGAISASLILGVNYAEIEIGEGGAPGTIKAAGISISTGTIYFNHDSNSYMFDSPMSGQYGLVQQAGRTILGARGTPAAVIIDGGTLVLAHENAIAGATGITFGGGTLEFATDAVDVSSLLNSFNKAAIRIDTGGIDVAFGSGVTALDDNGLEKLGAGSLTMAGVNTYAGPTTVRQGSFVVEGTLANGAVTVLTPGLLAGTGTIGGIVAVSGTLAPGRNVEDYVFGGVSLDPRGGATLGTLSMGGLALDGSAATVVHLGTAGSRAAPGASDRLLVAGTASLAGTLILGDALAAGGDYPGGAGSYLILSAAETSGTFASIVNLDGFRAAIAPAASSGSAGVDVFLDNYRLAAAAPNQTVNLGAVHAGSSATAPLTLTNTAVADAVYTETLRSGSFTNTTSGFVATGAVAGIAGGTSGAGTLQVGVGTSIAGGTFSGTTTLALFSDAVNSSGLGEAAIAPQTITITGTAWNMASVQSDAGTTTTEIVTTDNMYDLANLAGAQQNLGNFHVGDGITQGAFFEFSVNNAAPADGYSEGLTVRPFSSDVNSPVALAVPTSKPGIAMVYGECTNLTAGGASLFAVQPSTSYAGGQSAVAMYAAESTGVTTSGLGTSPLGTLLVPLRWTVWNRADAVPEASTIDFRTVRVGTNLSTTLAVENMAPAENLFVSADKQKAYTDPLSAGLKNASSGVTAGGYIPVLTGGQTSTNLTVGVSTATPGVVNGSVTLYAEGNPYLNTGMTSYALPDQQISVTATVNALANPVFEAPALLTGGGTLYTIDFGRVRVGAESAASLTLQNLTGSLIADSLAGNWNTATGNAFNALGFMNFGKGTGFPAIMPEGTYSYPLEVFFHPSSTGQFTGQIELLPRSTNDFLPDLALEPIIIDLIGIGFQDEEEDNNSNNNDGTSGNSGGSCGLFCSIGGAVGGAAAAVGAAVAVGVTGGSGGGDGGDASDIPVVPEPSTNVMLLGVLVTLAFGLRRRQAARRITRPFSSAR